jgi:hypothetical protein
VQNEYRDPVRELEPLREVIRTIGVREASRRAGVGHSAVSAFTRSRDPSIPRPATLAKLRRVAAETNCASRSKAGRDPSATT